MKPHNQRVKSDSAFKRVIAWRCVGALCVGLMLASCAGVDPGKGGPGPSTPPSPAPVQSPRPGPSPEVTPPPVPPAPPPPPRVDVRHALEQVRAHLNQGEEEPALVELKRVLEAEPENKSALGFMRQIQDDPKLLYGRVSQPYKVMAGDTLALIAQRGLSDRDQFYGLARYNGVKVPSDLKVGQVLQIPGAKRLPPQAPPQPQPQQPPPVQQDPPAPQPAPAPAPPSVPAPNPKVEVARLLGNARATMKRQDLCGAIKLYDAVLKLDPDNQAAQLERTRAVELNSRLPSRKC